MDSHARKVAEVREEGLYGEENYHEDEDDEETVNAGIRIENEENPSGVIRARAESGGRPEEIRS